MISIKNNKTDLCHLNTWYKGNSSETHKEKMLKQLEELWKYAQNTASDERSDPPKLGEISKEEIVSTKTERKLTK